MPPLAFTHAKYAAAMFEMSVNEVPGWLVTMTPSGIGVPVAAAPALVPHCDVLTAAVLGALLPLVLLGVVELLELPHPAAASTPATAIAVTVQRTPGVCFRLPTYPHLRVVKARSPLIWYVSRCSPAVARGRKRRRVRESM